MDRNITRASNLGCATLSDALDRLGIAGQCLGIKPLSTNFRLVGRATTLLFKAADGTPGTVGDYIDDIAPGSVLALDNAGREDATVWGEILTLTAQRLGLAGTVIDGACRDIQFSLDCGYPIFCRSRSMRTGRDRVQLEAIDVPVTIGQARVRPGDILRGDADGVVAIPASAEEDVLRVAEEIVLAEQRIWEAVESGSRLDDAREANRYFQLQKLGAKS